tara:strand:+ start:232 stop:528 length:297 start_codon:yes stop_codon:yes gene_type:complete
MNITKQELHQIIKEELISVMYEITQPKDINWELISKNYLKALFHNDPDLNYSQAKDKVKQEVTAAREQPGGIESLRSRVLKQLNIDITTSVKTDKEEL